MCCKNNCGCKSNDCCRYNGPTISELGITTGMLVDDVLALISNFVSDISFEDGNGIESVTNNGNGTFTFLFTDGTTFTTPDLRGADGSLTGYTSKWKYSSSTTTPPPITFIRFNNSSLPAATKMYVSETDLNSINKAPFLENFTNNTPTGSGDIFKFGIVKIFDLADINKYSTYELTGVTYQSGYQEFDIVYLQSNDTITNTTNVGLTFTPSEEELKTVVVPISGWDMDTTNLFNYAHGLSDFTKIVDVQVMIKNNLGTAVNPLNMFDGTSVQGGVNAINSTNIVLLRLTGGIFDAPSWNGSGDRGYLTMKYLK